MKIKRFKFLILSTFIFTIISCEDAIEIDQPGRLAAENAFETIVDFEAGMNWLYNNLDSTPEIALSAVYTDEVAVGKSSGGQGLSQLNYVLTAASAAPDDFWQRNYDIVNFSTRMIEASKGMPEDVNQDDLASYVGQAHAIRAYAMFELLSYFSVDYSDDNGLGVIAIDYVPALDEQLPRNTVGETFSLIDNDISEALSKISALVNDNTYFTLDAVNALKARAAAYRQDYATAKSVASTLLAKYPLADTTDYPLIFSDDSDEEVIFKLERTIGDSYDGQGSMGSVYAGGWAGARFCFSGANEDPYFEIGRTLFNILDPDDVRYDVLVHPSSEIDPDYSSSDDYKNTDVLYVGKYRGSEGQDLMNDLKIFRSSEMLLIIAEAEAAAGDLAAAASSIKTLRDARFGEDTTAPVFSTPEQAFGAILDERRIEFAFEGHRYKDLKRLGVRGNRNAVKDPSDCELAGAANCSLLSSDYRFTLPIPIVEFRGNSVISSQQNPGY